MNKKAVAHVEVIVSFVLFVGFLIFALYFFNPLDTTRVLDSTLYYATDSIVSNLSSQAYIYGISIQRPNPHMVVSLPLDVLDLPSPRPSGLRVENESGQQLRIQVVNGNLFIERKSSAFLKVISGDFITEQTDGLDGQGAAGTLQPSGYSISSSDIRPVHSEMKALQLKQFYESNYMTLKTQFNLPRRTDFAFSLNRDGTVIVNATQPVPEQVEVFSQNKRIEFISAEGEVVFIDLLVRVW